MRVWTETNGESELVERLIRGERPHRIYLTISHLNLDDRRNLTNLAIFLILYPSIRSLGSLEFGLRRHMEVEIYEAVVINIRRCKSDHDDFPKDKNKRVFQDNVLGKTPMIDNIRWITASLATIACHIPKLNQYATDFCVIVSADNKQEDPQSYFFNAVSIIR
ncbi:hypothetical protein J6590_025257 [Homalodisca vitripennis]|nr:hypothetical protein J6590_025257 [Homalodisca vitripennis]